MHLHRSTSIWFKNNYCPILDLEFITLLFIINKKMDLMIFFYMNGKNFKYHRGMENHITCPSSGRFVTICC